MSNLPLVQAVNNHIKKDSISFHVPGHKNGLIYEGSEKFKHFLANDLTELTNLDDLHSPEGAIAIAENRLTKLYKSCQSFFLVGGSTVGNLSMILATVKRGSKVLVQRNSHKSVFNALKLVNASPVFISPEIDTELGVAIGPSYDTVKLAIDLNSDAKAIILTYPNYYGHTYNIKKLIELAHLKEMIVLVDEAHGAHFRLEKPFPKSSLAFGADIVVQSAHKTLPAMTMGSWIHVNSKKVSLKKIREFLEMLQSSSPSYPIMMSLDEARNFLESFTLKDIENTLLEINKFYDNLSKIKELKVIKTDDPLKLIIRSNIGFTGKQLQAALEENDVFAELADHKNVLLIMPLLKINAKYPFEKALNAIKKSAGKSLQILENTHMTNQIYKNTLLTELEIPYSKMDEWEEKRIPLLRSVGAISAETIIPYPPGIPLIIRGEKITLDMVSDLKICVENNIRLQGGTFLKLKELLIFNKN